MAATSSSELPIRTAEMVSTTSSSQPLATPSADEFDVVATYHRLLRDDPDLTRPVAAIEALIDVLRHTPSSTAMETYEITGAQVRRLLAALPNALPVEAGTSLFTNYLSMALRGLPAWESIRQHLLDNSQLFVQRAKEARHRIADHGGRLVGPGDVVLTAGGSRAVRELLIQASSSLSSASLSSAGASSSLSADASSLSADASPSSKDTSPPSADASGASGASGEFTVLYVCDDRAPDDATRAIALLRQHRIHVVPIDPSAVAYCLDAHRVRAVLVGAEAVTHDGKLVSRIGTYQLAVLAHAAGKPVYALAETHKFVRKLLLNNADLGRIGIQQGFVGSGSGSSSSNSSPSSSKPPLKYDEQVDVTPPSLITGIITENGIIQPSGAYRIVSY